MPKPKDFVKLPPPPATGELSEVIRDILRRIHDQPFMAIQIVDLVQQESDAPRKKIAEMVRTIVSREVRKGKIKVLRRGGIIDGNRVAGVYCVLPQQQKGNQ